MNSGKKNVSFDYNAFGNRIAKHVFDDDWNLEKSTYYILDAQGNQLSMYEHVVDENEATVNYTLSERNIYGSSRLGKNNQRVDVFATHTENSSSTVLGETFYELSNHLGNVLTVINDIKIPLSDDNETVSEYQAGIVSISDYSPFGVQLDERTLSAEGYRYGFNTQERVDEISGAGNHYTAEFWEYSPRVVHRWNTDPKPNPSFSPYAINQCNPIWFSDPYGDTIKTNQEGFDIMNEGFKATLGEKNPFQFDSEQGTLTYNQSFDRSDFNAEQLDLIDRYTFLINSETEIVTVVVVDFYEKIDEINGSLKDERSSGVTQSYSLNNSLTKERVGGIHNVYLARNPQKHGGLDPFGDIIYQNERPYYRGLTSIHEIAGHAYLSAAQPGLAKQDHNELVEEYENKVRTFYLFKGKPIKGKAHEHRK